MSNDPTATPATPSQPAAGWYPDPSGESIQRWWDGTAWTAQTYDPAAVGGQLQPAKVAEGTPVYTPWIWFIAFLPILSVIGLFFFDFGDYLRASFDSSLATLDDPTAIPDPFAGVTPGYLALNALSFLIYALEVVFSFLDRRVLKQRGFDRPFHWAWAFLSSWVYIIGRSVIVHRRSGTGLAPIWWSIAIFLLSLAVSGIIVGSALAEVLPDIAPQMTTAP